MISLTRWQDFVNDIMPDNLIQHAKENSWLVKENENNNRIIDDYKQEQINEVTEARKEAKND